MKCRIRQRSRGGRGSIGRGGRLAVGCGLRLSSTLVASWIFVTNERAHSTHRARAVPRRARAWALAACPPLWARAGRGSLLQRSPKREVKFLSQEGGPTRDKEAETRNAERKHANHNHSKQIDLYQRGARYQWCHVHKRYGGPDGLQITVPENGHDSHVP